MSECSISKTIEFDAAHRVPFHESKCYNVHGHRYQVTASIVGPIQDPDPKNPESGMVVDFGVLKRIMMDGIHDVFDHKFVVWEQDPLFGRGGDWAARAGQYEMPGRVYVGFIPTAENFAKAFYEAIATMLPKWAEMESVMVNETPTSTAIYSGGDVGGWQIDSGAGRLLSLHPSGAVHDTPPL